VRNWLLGLVTLWPLAYFAFVVAVIGAASPGVETPAGEFIYDGGLVFHVASERFRNPARFSSMTLAIL